MVKKFKVGVVQSKKDGKGVTVLLGSKSKDPKYTTVIELVVKDASGKVLAKTSTKDENVYLQVVDPRTRKNKDGTPLSEEQLSKIPAFIKHELNLVVAE